MEVVRFADAPFYTAPGHEEVIARRLQGGAASSAGFVLVGHSTFPAGSVIPMAAGLIDKIYIITEGTLLIEQADGVEHVLTPGDSIFVAVGEARAVSNKGPGPAAMIVLTPSVAG